MDNLKMNAKEVAEQILKCNVITVYRLCRQKKIPHYKIGSRYIFDRVRIERWLLENEVNISSL